MNEKVKQYFENPRRICAVEADETYNLIVTFDNGERKCYSMKDELIGVFSFLQDLEKFKSVFIDEFGNVAWNIDENIDSSIHWNNRVDICKDAIYMNSVLISDK